jgi:succinate dehydrogenase / fumarate reductase flavoprotein subunit
MGNSLLDIIVFGRNAGKNASQKAKDVQSSALTLSHVNAFANERQNAGFEDETVSPKLLPDYARKVK